MLVNCFYSIELIPFFFVFLYKFIFHYFYYIFYCRIYIYIYTIFYFEAIYIVVRSYCSVKQHFFDIHILYD